MDVGVRELKQKLSEFLRRVELGETIRITDRGIPKALISPIEEPDRLRVGIEQGWIRPPATVRPLGSGQRLVSARRSLDLLREDRGE